MNGISTKLTGVTGCNFMGLCLYGKKNKRCKLAYQKMN